MADESYKEGETLISRHGDRQVDLDSDEGEFCQIELQDQQQDGRFTEPSSAVPSSGQKTNCFVFMASVMASLGGILFGYDIGIISGAILQLRDVFCLSCLYQELVISAMLMGAVLGSLIGGFLIDWYGRRLTIIMNSVVFLVGALILGLTPNFPVLVVGRLLVGFAVSVSATGECIYISEIAPAKRRGLLVSLNELGITLGLLLAYLCNFLFIDMENGWRWMFSLSAIPAVVQGIGMFFLPPSPRYLMLKKKEEKAEQVLQKLRGVNRVDKEISGIRVSIASEKNQSCIDLCASQDGMRGRMMVGVGLVFFQQFTGQPNVLYYAPTIFEEIGFKSDSAATLATVGLGIIKVVMTVIALFCVDKFGRRKFLITGAILMGISILTLGVVCHFEQSGTPPKTCIDEINCHNTGNIPQNYVNISHKQIFTTTDQANAHILFITKNNSVAMKVTTTPKIDSGHQTSVNQSNTSESQSHSKSVIKRDTHSNNASAMPETSSSDNQTKGDNQGQSWEKVIGFAAIMVYVAAYGFSFGPVTWLVLSEIFPAAVKGRAIAMATVFNWGTNLIVTFTFLDVMNGLGVSGTFILFSIICGISVLFIFSFVPETKNKTLEQVSADMKNRPPSTRMKQNFSFLLSCCVGQGGVRVHSSYRRVQSESVA